MSPTKAADQPKSRQRGAAPPAAPARQVDHPTRAARAAAEETLSIYFGVVYVRADGHLLRLERREIGKNRLAIVVWVDGAIRYADGYQRVGDDESVRLATSPDDLPEIGRRYWRLVASRLSAKDLEYYRKTLGAKSAGYREAQAKRWYRATPWWGSARPLFAHLLKNNDSVVILDREAGEAALEECHRQRASARKATGDLPTQILAEDHPLDDIEGAP